MDYKNIYIIGIGGCASSAIGEFLNNQGLIVSGSDMSEKKELHDLIKKGITVHFGHKKENLYTNGKPDIVLYTPAIIALNPNNPELLEAKAQGIKTESWEEFIGDFLKKQGNIGITVSGSEGKGTTAGILTAILAGTQFDPLSILGAKIKNIKDSNDSNIYIGEGKTYILEGDEYNRNFLHYHPDINVMINFDYEHPETYKNFDEYSQAFADFFNEMSGKKKLILRATEKIVNFVNTYTFSNITWFGYPEEIRKSTISGEIYIIENHRVTEKGNTFTLRKTDSSFQADFMIPALPGYIALNGTGAIIAALEVGMTADVINKNLQNFKGMVRRFDLYKTNENGVFITDYGHSPGAVGYILKEIRELFPDKKVHLIFQPHLFSRTYNFFNEFVDELAKADTISILDIYPARENIAHWSTKVNSQMLTDQVLLRNPNVTFAGQAKDIVKNMENVIDANEVTCFIGAGDMDQYYEGLLHKFGCKPWF
ncbi:MAG: hypothetical protein A2015_10890 [Spirochaetes bacterium GWF1_31_7]|nr:MAG: hypothetical protein A2Y30_13025 [Spirochaetes bacterium GWE1_32_154]OHD48364.1 MAG: hypothetical protein A2015_10890 [Spirochaetes bacterium GWF1_31_7]OHD50457.1 MAG: hypothetical protein A2Y29_11070 [Spirochaetes bacterium GWE2_31_10]OHD81595.1 MAG: hypothetical protein A2355_17760 [Spirochaetes bacterium RIFOXYB1_FULL_32_8]HBD96367.1 hypothetical protein [Spirochaetia bacterium]